MRNIDKSSESSSLTKCILPVLMAVLLPACVTSEEVSRSAKAQDNVDLAEMPHTAEAQLVADLVDGDENPEQLMSGNPVSLSIPSAVALGARATRIDDTAQPNLAEGPIFRPLNMPTILDNALVPANLIQVHSLNIGAGSCHIVDCPGTDLSLVIDCGSMSPTADDLTAEEVSAYIKTVVKGEYILVLSHGDRDHVNLVPKVLTGLTTRSIWLGGDLSDYRGDVATFIENRSNNGVPIFHGWEAGFANGGKPVKELQCGDASSYILTVNVGSSTNSQSLVLLTDYGNFKAIFSGDAHGSTEEAVIDSYGALIKNTTLLTASHHGSRSHDSNHDNWTERVDPNIVIYSSGVSHGHPNDSVSKRYRDNIDGELSGHPFWTAKFSGADYELVQSSLAEYVTEKDGIVVVESNGITYDVKCSLDQTCF